MRAVNLLTPDMRSAPKGKGAGPSAIETTGGIGAIAVLGALALCVAALAGYVLANNVVKQRAAELAQVSAEADATRAAAAKLKPYTDFEAVARQRAGTVQALASARFDWEQALRDLSRAVPGDVYLTSLDGTVGGANTGGSSLRGSIASPAIELKGCTKSQPAVAALMSRLRNVQGVTRVALSKSDKDAGTGSGGSTVNPCGKGTPPSFEMVVFFERSAVATALAGATGEATSAQGGAAPAGSGASGQQSGQSNQSNQSNGQSQGGNQPAGDQASNSSPAASTGGAK